MAAITTEQKKEIRRLTRAANRRLERATPGQRSALEYYVNKSTGANKFSAATKGLTSEQAELKIKILNRFMEPGGISTRKGWDKIKRENVRKANETLTTEGYDLTDEELAEILIQVDTENTKDYYKSINLVEAAKYEMNKEAEEALAENPNADVEFWTGSAEQIKKALAEKKTYQQALTDALQARIDRGKN